MDDVITLKDGLEMVLIPEGKFTFGISDDELVNLYGKKSAVAKYRDEMGELPQEEVFLPNYYIDKYPITNRLFGQFLQETQHRKRPQYFDSSIWGSPNSPVVGINWEDATAYATWAGKHLPNEKEWEKAARGTDGRLFPWGEATAGASCNCAESGLECTSEVGSFPASASPYGIHDMAGNVWEMTTDYWTENLRAMRGGCYLTYQIFCRATARWAPSPEELRKGPRWLGFRCVYVP
jgi:formylglycine-generating enzyme required for sulfatase activity